MIALTSLTQRFAIWFAFVALLPIALVGYGLMNIFEREIQRSAIEKVSSLADKKVEQLEFYLHERIRDAHVIQAADSTRQALLEFTEIFEKHGVDSDIYHDLNARYHDNFARFLEGAGYYDLFLISLDGWLVFTVAHESDFATNLFVGPFSDTGLGKVFRQTLETQKNSLSDFENYEPSHGAVAAFIGVPVLIEGQLRGVLALQIYGEHVFDVLTNNVGLGESGETVVTRFEGEDSALVMSPLREDPDAAMKRRLPLDDSLRAWTIRNSLSGLHGGGVSIDYRGLPVVAAWRHVPSMNWGMVVQKDAAEAFASVTQMRAMGLVVLGLTFMLAILGALLFNRRVVIPLKSLNECAQAISSGNFQQQMPKEGWEEIGQLASAFNAMSDRLNVSYRHLEARVAERTVELEKINAELAIKEEETRSVVDHMVDCVVTTDERGVILSVNPVMQKLFGYASEEAIGQNVAILVPEPDRSKHEFYMQRYCETGHGQEYVGRPYLPEGHGVGLGREVEAVHKSGRMIPVYLAVSEYLVGNNRHFIGVMRDISEHVKIRQDLEQARLEAEQANQAKSAFLAAMSHEIRTPMNGVIGMIDVLSQTSLSGYQKEMADLIRESAFALLEIIEDILDFSKIEAGRLEIERAPMSLATVVERACGMLEHLASNKEVELTLFVDPVFPESVLGDALRLRQVLVNLINNAIKFSSGLQRPGRVTVQVIPEEIGEDVATVLFQITDNGIGMNEATQRRLFTPFSQGDASTTRRFGGTGLGLTICRRLVELLHGEIEVRSKPDVGSTFTVKMPFKILQGESLRDDENAIDLTGLSCLVLGREEGLSRDLAAYLKYAGAVVELVSSLSAARKRIKTLPPGQWLLVIDAGDLEPPVDELRFVFRTRANLGLNEKPHFVVIRRGRRHRGRMEDKGIVTIDGNILYRQAFLQAVAAAAGRAKLEDDQAVSGEIVKEVVPLSRDEALRQGKLILVAEDNEINQKVIRQQLTLLGYALDVAANGREAFHRWESGDYALILTDLHMPEMDGYQLTQTIRAGETANHQIPIIALTANALKGEAEKCLALGMNDYLSKPVQLEQLRTALEKWLPGSKQVARSAGEAGQISSTNKKLAVNVDMLKALIGDDSVMIGEFLQDFRLDTKKIAEQIKTASSRGRFEEIKAAAHKLKSSARSVGALALGEWCAQIEAAAKDCDAKILATLLPCFEAELVDVEACIEKICGHPGE
jgi:two-component system, sensor histidine kinase and response regulator